MLTGKCNLCLKNDVKLQHSHLLPRAIYKHILHEFEEPHYMVSPTKSKQGDKQIKEYFLCADCEQRFNSGGESWVLSNYNSKTGHFPLLEKIGNTKPTSFLQDIALYSAIGVPSLDVDKLCYFATSVFWRAAASDWKIMGNKKRLRLGKYQEQLRCFLLGGNFPDKVTLHVYVSPSKNAYGSFFFPHELRSKEYHHYCFSLRGMIFNMCVGNRINAKDKLSCIMHSPERPIFVTPLVDSMSFSNAITMVQGVKSKLNSQHPVSPKVQSG